MHSPSPGRWFAIVSFAFLAAFASNEDSQLRYIVILSRHGVRSPTARPEDLNRYSAEPWPDWGVAPGMLTPHGRDLMRILGAWNRSYLSEQGLVSPTGCAEAKYVFAWSDTDARCRESGAALLDGMLPGCNATAQSRPPGERDPLFKPFESEIAPSDQGLAAAAILGQIGGHPEALAEVHRPAFEELERVLLGCLPGRDCPAKENSKRSVISESIAVKAGTRNAAAEVTGALHTGSSLAENLLLEYLNGWKGPDLGWGRLNESNLQEIMRLHTAYADLARKTPYIARAHGSNLMSRILSSMQQAQSAKAVKGALGKVDGRVLLLVGHDTNASNISGLLGINWLLPGDQPGDPVPGGALVFELRQSVVSKAYFVRVYYTAQSHNQMRNATPLSADRPPLRAPIFVPGCGTSSEGFECDWTRFEQTVSAAIDRRFVAPVPE
jgi:4-phytase/acid phosphatase